LGGLCQNPRKQTTASLKTLTRKSNGIKLDEGKKSAAYT